MDQYKRTRFLYILFSDFEYLISVLVTGAFLARLTDYLGFSDSLTGIISAMVSLGGLFQVLSVLLRKKRVKGFVIRMNLITQALFLFLYVIPLTPIPAAVRTGVFLLSMLGAYFCKNLAAPKTTNWFFSMVDARSRGRFTAIMEASSLVAGSLITYVMGGISDHYKELGQIKTAFFLCACVILVLNILLILTLIFSVEREEADSGCVEREKTDSGRVEYNLLRRMRSLIDRKVFCVIVVSIMWSISTSVLASYYGSYQIKELGLELRFISIAGMITSVSRILSSFVLGAYADRHSFVRVWLFCFGVAAATYFVNIFTVPKNGAILFIIYSVGLGIFNAGFNVSRNLIFEYVDYSQRADVLAIMQAVSGLSGFVAALAVSPLVNRIQKNGNRFLGFSLYAQQVLSLIAFAFCVLAVLFLLRTLCRWEKSEK